MQTFIPYANFSMSAKVLDRQRLGKQRVEALQILKTLKAGPYRSDGKKTPWYNHPAVQMWKGYESALMLYLHEICNEWFKRGYRDTCWVKAVEIGFPYKESVIIPSWIGNDKFHVSHQSNLLRKDPVHYGQYFPGVPNDLPYVWPSKGT